MQNQKDQNKEELKWVRQSKLNRGTVSFIGNDTLIVGHGSAILCVDLKNGTEHTFRVAKPLADGVSDVSGHATMSMFAFAEQCNTARVFIMTYPDFKKVCMLSAPQTTSGGDEQPRIRRICSMVFSESEHLIVLTGFPSYELEVWNWRTQKLLGVQETGILTDMQFIKCNRAVPLTISQISYNIGLANIWEIHTSLDTVSMIKRPLAIPGANQFIGPYHCTHMPDGSIFVLNSTLNVWSVQPVTQKVTLVIENNLFPDDASPGPSTTSQLALLSQKDIASTLSNIEEDLTNKRVFLYSYRGNVSMIDSEGTLRVYKKNPVTLAWEPSFMLRAPVPFLAVAVPRDPDRQVIVGITTLGTVVRLDDQTVDRSWQVIKDYDRAFKLIAMIHPMGDVVVTVSEFNKVRALRVDSGQVLDTLSTGFGVVHCLLSCSTLPVVVFGNDNGIVYLYSIFNGTQLSRMAIFNLSDFGITDVLINNQATQLVALDESNALFVLKGQLGSMFEVTNHIKLVQHPIALTINSNYDVDPFSITSLLTPIVAPNKNHSNSLLQIQLSNLGHTHMVYGELSRNYITIQWLGSKDSGSSSNVFIAVPYLSNDFEVLQLIESDSSSRDSDPFDGFRSEVRTTCHTLHRVNALDLQIYDDFVLTWSMGGDVEMWDRSTWNVTNRIRAMNVWARGVKKTVTDQSMQHIVTVGFEDNLQCIFNNKHSMDTNKNFLIVKKLQSKEVKDLFAKQTTGYEPIGIHIGRSWVQVQLLEQREMEFQTYNIERRQCVEDLEALKRKVQALIDANEIAPEDEQLPIEEFNVDWEGITIAERSAQLQRNADENGIRQECEHLTAFTEAIKEISWNKMDVKGRNIRGIFTRLKVENYSLLYPEKEMEVALQKARVWRSTEQMVARNDTFQPWIPLSMEDLVAQLASQPDCVSPRNPDSLGGGDSYERLSNSLLAQKNQYTLTGTSSHNFIKPIPLRYSQLEVVTYYQMHLENVLGYHDALALRKYFNTKFDEMSVVKVSELQLASQRNERLRHIQSEMNKLEELKNSDVYHERDIVDPEFSPDEIPSSIVKVEPYELAITPYISPSEQQLLDAAAAEAERRRLALLADDFRERALMKMMNGVLEIRWEDEIKKTPPPPDCVQSGKDPKDYTPEDLSSILEWENEIKFLESERERYRVMLVNEQAKIDQTIDEQYRKFNMKVGTALMEKIQVEFAIASEDLKLLRNEQYHFRRFHLAGIERSLSCELRQLREEIVEHTTTLNGLEEKLTVCKTKYEDLTQKDRLLDRHFKSSYGEFASKPIVDQAFRVYKRRPKWQIRAWQTPTILNDMAKRIINVDSTRRGSPLPDECFTFLQYLDQLDKPSQTPNVFDAYQWQMLCKMRRVKLEMELRLRSLGGQVAEAESAVNGFVREINSKKASAALLEQRILEVAKDRREYIHNRSVQISMKRGIVEIPLTGHLTDFDNAILLHSSDVHDINQIIKKAGLKKLKTMQHAAMFRRKIILKEWEHEVLRTRIREKQMHIKCIQKTKITKELQLWLKYKQMGWKEDISELALSREVEACRRSLQAMCNEIISKINETDAAIATKKRTNTQLDGRIRSVNLHVTELNLARNIDRETRISKDKEKRLKMMVQRSRLVREIQLNHAKILELCTVLELQRLRTFPTLTVTCLQDLE